MTKLSISSGEALSFSAELIKALSPVLKKANPIDLERLKKNPRLLQQALNDIVNGHYPTKDWGARLAEPISIRCNQSNLRLRSNLGFDVAATLQGRGYAIKILVKVVGNDEAYILEVEFEDLFFGINNRTDLFVSLHSLHSRATFDDEVCMNEAVESAVAEYIATHGDLRIFWDDGLDRVFLSLECCKFYDEIELKKDQIERLVVK